VVSEVSPYVNDLDWTELTEPSEIGPVVDYLGRATAKVHSVADSEADHSLVPFHSEDAIAESIGGRDREFADWVVDFAHTYAAQVRADHACSSTPSAAAPSPASPPPTTSDRPPPSPLPPSPSGSGGSGRQVVRVA
jgi:hypothetical protein